MGLPGGRATFLVVVQPEGHWHSYRRFIGFSNLFFFRFVLLTELPVLFSFSQSDKANHHGR